MLSGYFGPGNEAKRDKSRILEPDLVIVRTVYTIGKGTDLIFAQVLKPVSPPVNITEAGTIVVAYYEPYKARPFATKDKDFLIMEFSSYSRPNPDLRVITLLKYVEGLDLDEGDTAVIGMALNYPNFKNKEISSQIVEEKLRKLKGKFDDMNGLDHRNF